MYTCEYKFYMQFLIYKKDKFNTEKTVCIFILYSHFVTYAIIILKAILIEMFVI